MVASAKRELANRKGCPLDLPFGAGRPRENLYKRRYEQGSITEHAEAVLQLEVGNWVGNHLDAKKSGTQDFS
jgi:hypothetical protein